MRIHLLACFGLALAAVGAPGCADAAGQRRAPEARRAFFSRLKPLVTWQEVVAEVGKPDFTYREQPAYRLSHGAVVVVEPVRLLLGDSGLFTGRIARVTLRQNGRSTVLYRLWDHWARLRPARLTNDALARRANALRRGGKTATTTQRREMGPPDGQMGSGMSWLLYWIPDGLVTIGPLETRRPRVSLQQPGAGTQVSFEKWLIGARPGPAR